MRYGLPKGDFVYQRQPNQTLRWLYACSIARTVCSETVYHLNWIRLEKIIILGGYR